MVNGLLAIGGCCDNMAIGLTTWRAGVVKMCEVEVLVQL